MNVNRPIKMSAKVHTGRQAERSEATRKALVDVGRKLFAKRGYADVGTEEIVRRAGVTRGALYHHFSGKEDLFRAVAEQVEEEMTRKSAEAALAHEDPWEQQRAGWDAFLDACLDPAVQRIILLDAPSVLGPKAWREIASKYGLALVQFGIQSLIDAGLIEDQPVDPLAHLVIGALSEAAVVIAQADDTQAARAEMGTAMERLMTGLRVESGGRPATRSAGRGSPTRPGRALG
jgi:AcrR family transcriptional regulator